MEESIKNISLDELAKIEGLNVRAQNLCEYNDLKDLYSIISFYRTVGNFRNLRNCGQKSNLELTNICKKYENLLIEPIIKVIPEFNINPEFEDCTAIQIELLLDEPKAFTPRKEILINNIIKSKFNDLSVRSSNALRNYLSNDISLSNLRLILLSKESTLRNIHNIGEKAITEIIDFINSIKQIIAVVIKTEDDKESTVEIFNRFLIKMFSLNPTLFSEIAKNYDFSNGLPIFRTLDVIIENEIIFDNKEKVIFKYRFNYYNDFKLYSLHQLAEKHELTKERVRQIQLNIFHKLVGTFSFLRGLEVESFNLYGIDISDDIIEIDNEVVNEINKNEDTNFNTHFINKILSIILYNKFTLIGNEEGFLFKKNSRASHNWNTTYLILNNYVKIFNFYGFVEDVSFRLVQRIEEEYSFHFQTYLLDFQKDNCRELIENIAQIAEYILFKEFELTIDKDENLVFKRNVRKQVIDYVYEVLEERHEPLTVYEIFEIIEQTYPGITKSAESLRGSCQRDSNLIYFGRSSTYGLKVWEDELNIKGGTIRNIVEEFLKLHDYPKHILEITEYVNLYRDTNTKNIISNLRLDDSGTFIFFNQSFIGLAKKKHHLEYLPYANIPKFLGKTLMAEIKEKGRVDFRRTVDFLSKTIPIAESNIEMIVRHFINENNLQIENNFISEANDNRRN